MRGADWNEAEGYDISRRQKWLLAAVAVVVVAAGVAAAVGAFVLGGTGTGPHVPQAAFDATVDPGEDGWGTGDETVRVAHDGGETLDPRRLALVVDDGAGYDAVSGVAWPTDGEWTAGETATYTGTIDDGTEFTLRWESPSGDSKQTLGEWTAGEPEASTRAVAFGVSPQTSNSLHSHSAVAFANRSWAARVDMVAG